MKKHRKYGGYIFSHCLPLCVISPSSVLMHRSLIDEIGLFDESLPACEDYDMWLRLCARYPVLYLEEKLLIKHGGHADQLSRQYWGMDRFRILALRKIIEHGGLAETELRAAIDMMLTRIAIYLAGAEKHGTTDYLEEFRELHAHYSGMDNNQSCCI